jgi:BASS family bile acid:Na+ symporter
MTDLLVPVCIALTMAVLGLELTAADFNRVLANPGGIVLATVGQIVLLPVASIGLVHALHPPVALGAGLLVVAACPGGALSNFCVYLARGSTALSVALTAVSTCLAVVTLPIVLDLSMPLVLEVGAAPSVPALQMILQLLLLVLGPMAIGMEIRRRRSKLASQLRPAGTLLGIVCVFLILGSIAWEQWETLNRDLNVLIRLAVVYSISMMLVGTIVGWGAGLGRADRFTCLIEFATRNYLIALLVGTTLLGADFQTFAVVFFVTQTVLALLAVAGHRVRHQARLRIELPEVRPQPEQI